MAVICQSGSSWGVQWLMRYSVDRHDPDIRALACILTHRCSCPEVPYRHALGLDAEEITAITGRYFPRAEAAGWPAGGCWRHHALSFGHSFGGGRHDDLVEDPAHGRFSRSLMEQEEQDLCRLFLNHATGPRLRPVVFARLISRACMEPEHLWKSLGLENRNQLTDILERHFAPLAAKNGHDMRWKKFFYKLLCDIEKVWTCTASSCEICPHHAECYAPEL